MSSVLCFFFFKNYIKFFRTFVLNILFPLVAKIISDLIFCVFTIEYSLAGRFSVCLFSYESCWILGLFFDFDFINRINKK